MSRTARRTDRLGQSLTSLCAGALALNLLLAIGLLALIATSGLATFWQRPLVLFALREGTAVLGEVHGHEDRPRADDGSAGGTRTRVKIGNRDLYGLDFRWIDDDQIVARSQPRDAVLLERFEWGNFYGSMRELWRGDERIADGADAVWQAFAPLHAEKLRQRAAITDLEQGAIGEVNYRLERLRLAERRLDLEPLTGPERSARQEAIAAQQAALTAEYERLAAELSAARAQLGEVTLVMVSADGREKRVPVGDVVTALRPNAMSTWETLRLYGARVWGFIADDPRESNTEGGIFPAIFGTVMMVFLMSFVVAPFGVIAALYLREYSREGPFVRAVRIAVNNLAGVPSIVFGVFGLGFFVYLIGGSIDRLFFPEALPTPTFGTGGILWASLTLALLTVPVVIVATEEGLAAVPRVVREGSLALGATKFETTWRVVVPAAAPGILTGMILAMARAAGEVAPLMIVGMVKLAPTLPIDHHFPFVHLERKFMHLGFHIYDVGFQSPNIEATQPLVFSTALLLVLVVIAMNLVAVVVRNRLRARYATSAV
ncbi:MAG: phosphate ABC transporter permease PstA [Candidatus Binatia bacterium]